jgi:1,4-dihydroxy-6-naphthoate synthase
MKIGISPCPNDVFIFSGWLLGRVPAPPATFVFEDVETLNGWARTGEPDLVKVSYANVPACAGYEALECGGALGRGCGPLLLTGGREWDPDAEVLVPGPRTTANFLLDHWYARHGGSSQTALKKRYLPFDALYRELKSNPEAQGVVIHEMRFTYAADGLRLVRDLGAEWEAATGTPIPLGAVIRKDAADSAEIPTRVEIETAIRASLDWAWAHEAEALELCARHAQDMTPAVMRSHIDLYVNAFSRDLGAEGRAAVALLLESLPR